MKGYTFIEVALILTIFMMLGVTAYNQFKAYEKRQNEIHYIKGDKYK